MLSRRTLLQSLASLLPLSALGIGGARTHSTALPAPPGGGGEFYSEKWQTIPPWIGSDSHQRAQMELNQLHADSLDKMMGSHMKGGEG